MNKIEELVMRDRYLVQLKDYMQDIADGVLEVEDALVHIELLLREDPETGLIEEDAGSISGAVGKPYVPTHRSIENLVRANYLKKTARGYMRTGK